MSKIFYKLFYMNSYFEFETFFGISVFSVINIGDSSPNINIKKKSIHSSSAFFHYNNHRYKKIFNFRHVSLILQRH